MIVLNNFRNREQYKTTTNYLNQNDINVVHAILTNGFTFISFENDEEKKQIFNYVFNILNIKKFDRNIEFIKFKEF